MSEKKSVNKIFKYTLVILTVISSIKMVLCGWTIDDGYAFAIGNRLLQGDYLFKDMWELHQTSGFAVEFFLWLFRKIFSSVEGEVVFVRMCGMMIHILVAGSLYFFLAKYIPKERAFYSFIIFVNLSPKQTCTPEFSNLLLWASTIVLICVMELCSEECSKFKSFVFSFTSGVFLSLCVLSYPQSIIFAVFVFAVVLFRSKYVLIDFLTILSVCLISGLSYLFNVLKYISSEELVETIKSMIIVDSTHSDALTRISGYGMDVMLVLLFSLGFGVLSVLIAHLIKDPEMFVPISVFLIFAWKFVHILIKNDTYPVVFTMGGLLISIILCGFWLTYKKTINKVEKKMLYIYVGGSLMVFLSAVIASNLGIFSSARFLVLGMAVVLSIGKISEDKKVKYINVLSLGVLLLILVTIFHLPNPRNALLNITDADARVPAGPQKGLIMERMYANKARIDWEELPAVLDGADFVMITGDAVTYLYTDARIGNGSTIMTEDYGERFGLYWEVYPEKKPDIIAIECYNGTLDYRVEMSWLYEYATGEFGADEVKDTTYYRLYIRNR